MAHRVNDDFVFANFIKNKIGIRQNSYPPDDRIIRSYSREQVTQQQFDNGTDASLNARYSLGCPFGYVIENDFKIGQRRSRIAQPHTPCFNHTARTSSSLAIAPAAAADLERVIASRSFPVR